MEQPIIVHGPDGILGTLPHPPDRAAKEIDLTLGSGEVVQVAGKTFEIRGDGSWFLNMSRRDILSKSPNSPKQTVVVPVVQEEPIIQKREVVAGSVQVHVHPAQRSEPLDIALSEEQAEVKRVPINRIVAHADSPRTEGDVTIIPVYEEVAVVERRLMLKEEIHIRRHRITRKENLTVPLRTEEVEISRSDR